MITRFDRWRTKVAFTLLELLVAMAVLAILVLLLMNMVDSATKLWRLNENRVDGYREPRAALGVIARDLLNSLTLSNTNSFRLNDGGYIPNGALSGPNHSHLFFLTSLPKNAQWSSTPNNNVSDVCEVGYFLAYGKTSSSSNSSTDTLNLYRFFLTSDDTFNLLNLSNSTVYPFPDPTSLTPTHRNVELLARNIVSMKATAYSAVDVTNTTNNSVSKELQAFVATTDRPMPDLVEITISAVNQDTARKLPNVSSWANTNALPIKDNIQTFTTRLRLENAP